MCFRKCFRIYNLCNCWQDVILMVNTKLYSAKSNLLPPSMRPRFHPFSSVFCLTFHSFIALNSQKSATSSKYGGKQKTNATLKNELKPWRKNEWMSEFQTERRTDWRPFACAKKSSVTSIEDFNLNKKNANKRNENFGHKIFISLSSQFGTKQRIPPKYVGYWDSTRCFAPWRLRQIDFKWGNTFQIQIQYA